MGLTTGELSIGYFDSRCVVDENDEFVGLYYGVISIVLLSNIMGNGVL